MNTLEEMRLAKKALDRGLVTLLQLKMAMTEYARERNRSEAGVRSLRGILVQTGAVPDEPWEVLLGESGTCESGSPAAGKPFGGYFVERELGRGGMGVVYEAVDSKRHRKVALKLLNAPAPGDYPEEAERRFLQESRLLAILPRHPSVVSVYEAGSIGGQRYIAMELVDGIAMSLWQRTAGLQEQLRVLRDVALAVHHAHGHGIIHRDLKPENVLIRRDDTPVVMDFGLATPEQRNLRLSLTPMGVVMGSPGYMSPEQARGLRGVDRTTDVYSMGVMLFQMLTGRMPFEGDSPMDILRKTAESPAPRPSAVMKKGLNPVLLQKLEPLCMRALSTKPKDRYSTAKAFAEELSTRISPATRAS